MVEIEIREHLSTALDVPVLLERPENEPDSYVLIEKTGGGESNMIESATLAVQSYAKRMHDAAALNVRVKAAMKASTRLDSISRCKLNTDYNFTDTTKKRYRYQAVFDIVYLGGDS